MIERARRAALSALLLGLCVHSVAAERGQLFNGKDLGGWAFLPDHEGPGFVVDSDELRTQGGTGLLWYTREKIGNSIIRVVYRISNEKGNSGVFIGYLRNRSPCLARQIPVEWIRSMTGTMSGTALERCIP